MTWHRLRTERLIERLVADLRPWQIERRIRTHRLWMAAVLAIALPPLALAQPFRADLASRLADAMFVASIATSAMIFVTGLVTVLILGTPGRSWLWLLVPLVAFGLWLVSESASIAVDLFREGWRAWAFETSPRCPLIIGAACRFSSPSLASAGSASLCGEDRSSRLPLCRPFPCPQPC